MSRLERIRIKAHGRSYTISVDPGSHIGGRIFNSLHPYEEPLLEDMYNEAPADSLAVDAGAHIGNHTLWMSEICGWEVYAFEPNPRDFEMLSLNVEGLPRVHARRYALGDLSGAGKNLGEGRIAYTAVEEEQEFPIVSLDHLFVDHTGRRIAVMKIDVEGFEPRVIRGSREVIKSHRPTIYAEARDESSFAANSQELKPLGYEVLERFHGKQVATPVDKWVYVG